MFNLEPFFKNRNLVVLIDAMAKRYGKTPSEVLQDSTLFEFNFNMAVFVIGQEESNISHEPVNKNLNEFAEFKISKTVIDNRKKEVD